MRHWTSPQICSRHQMPEIHEAQAKCAYNPDHMAEFTIREVTGAQSTSTQFLYWPSSTRLLSHPSPLPSPSLD